MRVDPKLTSLLIVSIRFELNFILLNFNSLISCRVCVEFVDRVKNCKLLFLIKLQVTLI
jgi:hypothetical protein